METKILGIHKYWLNVWTNRKNKFYSYWNQCGAWRRKATEVRRLTNENMTQNYVSQKQSTITHISKFECQSYQNLKSQISRVKYLTSDL